MIFMAALPYSGSTAIAAFLATGARAMLLQERGEGQWLVPGLCENDRWESTKRVDLRSVRAVWLRKFQEHRRHASSTGFVIEKSPPNLVRFDALMSTFARTSAFACSRDPIASCASLLRNHHPYESLEGQARDRVLDGIVDKWIVRSRQLRTLIDRLGLPVLAYERFCLDPVGAMSGLDLPAGLLEGIVSDVEISVKGGPARPIENRDVNARAVLRKSDLDRLVDRLRPEQELLAFFGRSPDRP